MRPSQLKPFLVGLIVMVVVVGLGFTSGHDRNIELVAISESIHITKADGVKPLSQLIREQSDISIPDQPISKFHFVVDSLHGTLIFPRNDFQPEGFEMSIAAGDDKEFKIPRLQVNGAQALDFFLVKTDKVCNFVVYIEFYPNK